MIAYSLALLIAGYLLGVATIAIFTVIGKVISRKEQDDGHANT